MVKVRGVDALRYKIDPGRPIKTTSQVVAPLVGLLAAVPPGTDVILSMVRSPAGETGMEIVSFMLDEPAGE
jgi:hypothetical protein